MTTFTKKKTLWQQLLIKDTMTTIAKKDTMTKIAKKNSINKDTCAQR